MADLSAGIMAEIYPPEVWRIYPPLEDPAIGALLNGVTLFNRGEAYFTGEYSTGAYFTGVPLVREANRFTAPAP